MVPNRFQIRDAIIAIVVLCVTALAGTGASASAALPALDAQSMCASHTSAIADRYGIPPHLLDAISIAESGRWDEAHHASVAWPWTVSSGGDGKYFPTKGEAIAEVRRLKAAGVRNIDVGCMQVNLMYHPEAFASLDDAFEPSSNVAYAARFLKGLFDATNHWMTAASYYHSQTPSLAAEYLRKLEKIWDNITGTTQVAQASRPVTPPQAPRPSLSGRVDEMRAAWKARSDDVDQEAKRIADAYRQARLAEYMLRRQKMIDSRQQTPAQYQRVSGLQ
jgi:hypothetical protein